MQHIDYFKELGALTSRYEIYKILKKFDSKRICEVGVDHGWNLTHLCKCDPELAVAVDLWDISGYYDFYDLAFHERNYLEICRRSIEENRCILPIRMDSLKAVSLFSDSFFDFIYIDAAHDYASVTKNITAWWRKLKPGGFMGGHDYFDGSKQIDNARLRLKEPGVTTLDFGVKSAVDKFMNENSLTIQILKDENGIDSWFLYKD